eukprot:1159644-Pelagomonas_calceolata.AAC.3
MPCANNGAGGPPNIPKDLNSSPLRCFYSLGREGGSGGKGGRGGWGKLIPPSQPLAYRCYTSSTASFSSRESLLYSYNSGGSRLRGS